MVLDAVRQEHHALRIECLHGTLIVRHEHHGTLVGAQGVEDLPT
ncbi:hypothetical protein ACFFX0_00065 [Citricoccus parietis]|uniref:Uncharacterized protein n=1 Tax=Citricoccus parietis TaxID=592307 RepID=A0ABV5FSM4_9MICC